MRPSSTGSAPPVPRSPRRPACGAMSSASPCPDPRDSGLSRLKLNLANSRPDFVLQCNDTHVPVVAVFVDGRTFHATTQHNRLADDAAKREVLRGSGVFVLSITSRDLDNAGHPAAPPFFFNAQTIAELIDSADFMASPHSYELLKSGPLDLLMRWVTEDVWVDRPRVARAVPAMLLSNAAG